LEFLAELDLQLNQIASIEEFEKLVQYENLRNLDLKQNNFIDDNEHDYMFQIIAKIPQLTQINDFQVRLE
jgi:Leucine-rich repeat (LRR) protein